MRASENSLHNTDDASNSVEKARASASHAAAFSVDIYDVGLPQMSKHRTSREANTDEWFELPLRPAKKRACTMKRRTALVVAEPVPRAIYALCPSVTAISMLIPVIEGGIVERASARETSGRVAKVRMNRRTTLAAQRRFFDNRFVPVAVPPPVSCFATAAAVLRGDVVEEVVRRDLLVSATITSVDSNVGGGPSCRRR